MQLGIRPLFPKLLPKSVHLHHQNDRVNYFPYPFNQPEFKILTMLSDVDNNASNKKSNANESISYTHDDSGLRITF